MISGVTEVHPSLFITVIVYVPGSASNEVSAWKSVPLMLYVSPAPTGLLTVITPVFTVQEGCVTATFAIAGTTGAELIITGTDREVHPSPFLTVTGYE